MYSTPDYLWQSVRPIRRRRIQLTHNTCRNPELIVVEVPVHTVHCTAHQWSVRSSLKYSRTYEEVYWNIIYANSHLSTWWHQREIPQVRVTQTTSSVTPHFVSETSWRRGRRKYPTCAGSRRLLSCCSRWRCRSLSLLPHQLELQPLPRVENYQYH